MDPELEPIWESIIMDIARETEDQMKSLISKEKPELEFPIQ
jgi:hypothetical protein